MKRVLCWLLLWGWAWARPTPFSDGKCRVVFPSASPVTSAYGYRRDGNHYLLYCSAHHHPGSPPHYPRTDDALRTLLAPNQPYRPGY